MNERGTQSAGEGVALMAHKCFFSHCESGEGRGRGLGAGFWAEEGDPVQLILFPSEV